MIPTSAILITCEVTLNWPGEMFNAFFDYSPPCTVLIEKFAACLLGIGLLFSSPYVDSARSSEFLNTIYYMMKLIYKVEPRFFCI